MGYSVSHRQKDKQKVQKAKDKQKESLILWCQGSFALLRCLFIQSLFPQWIIKENKERHNSLFRMPLTTLLLWRFQATKCQYSTFEIRKYILSCLCVSFSTITQAHREIKCCKCFLQFSPSAKSLTLLKQLWYKIESHSRTGLFSFQRIQVFSVRLSSNEGGKWFIC